MTEKEQAIKDNLKQSLPYGSNTEIKKRVQQQFNRVLSSSMVGNVLNPNKEAWDNDVISVALDIVAEDAKKRKAIDEKASNLSII